MTRREEIEELAREVPAALEAAQQAEERGDEQTTQLLDIIEALTLALVSFGRDQSLLDTARHSKDHEKMGRYGQRIRRDLRIVEPLVTSCKVALRLEEEREP